MAHGGSPSAHQHPCLQQQSMVRILLRPIGWYTLSLCKNPSNPSFLPSPGTTKDRTEVDRHWPRVTTVHLPGSAQVWLADGRSRPDSSLTMPKFGPAASSSAVFRRARRVPDEKEKEKEMQRTREPKKNERARERDVPMATPRERRREGRRRESQAFGAVKAATPSGTARRRSSISNSARAGAPEHDTTPNTSATCASVGGTRHGGCGAPPTHPGANSQKHVRRPEKRGGMQCSVMKCDGWLAHQPSCDHHSGPLHASRSGGGLRNAHPQLHRVPVAHAQALEARRIQSRQRLRQHTRADT